MTTPDVEATVEASHQALAAFVRGDPEPLKALFSKGDDISLANPFGPPVRGWADAAATMERAATFYRDGDVGGFERFGGIAGPELCFIVEVERYRAKVGGGDEMTPLLLRVTTVFRLEDGAWRIVHRHADPIATARSAESVISRG